MSAKQLTVRERPTSEANRICNLVPSTGTDRDWGFGDAIGIGALRAADRPVEKDLRQSWWDIGDQELTGSCVGWATAEGLMRYHLVRAGRLKRSQHLSVRHVWMGSKETDEYVERPDTYLELSGTSLKSAVRLCTKLGVVTDDLLPFHLMTTLYAGQVNAFWAAAAQRRASGYFNLGRDVEQWKTSIAQDSPVLVGLSVDATWDNATATGGKLDTFQPGTVRGGHAVCAVGYRSDGRIILRNSWGTNWGDHGFGYASPSYIAEAFFPESYVVTV